MLSFFARIFGYFLNSIYSVVNNYGLAIIVFTVLLKIIMLPISIKQQKTLKKSAKIQAQAKEIQEKYRNDQVRQSQEVMELYKKENMSPFSGCLSSIVQFILLISIFYLVRQPLTYMKNVSSDIISNYSSQIEEDQRRGYEEIYIIKNFGEKDPNVYVNMNFLGLDLSDIPSQNMTNWKVFIIPVLYVATSIASMRLTTALNKAKPKEVVEEKIEVKENEEEKSLIPNENKENEAMDEYMKQMNLFMPLMTVSIALIAPLGLALYWFVSNLLMILERLIINKFFKEEEEEA